MSSWNFVSRRADAKPARPGASPPRPVVSLAPTSVTASAMRRYTSAGAMGRAATEAMTSRVPRVLNHLKAKAASPPWARWVSHPAWSSTMALTKRTDQGGEAFDQGDGGEDHVRRSAADAGAGGGVVGAEEADAVGWGEHPRARPSMLGRVRAGVLAPRGARGRRAMRRCRPCGGCCRMGRARRRRVANSFWMVASAGGDRDPACANRGPCRRRRRARPCRTWCSSRGRSRAPGSRSRETRGARVRRSAGVSESRPGRRGPGRSRGCRRGPGRGRSARASCAAACRAGVRPRGSGGTESAHGDGSRWWRACAGGGPPAGEGSSGGGGFSCRVGLRSVFERGGGSAQSSSAAAR
jgi:hypothetical protein